MNIPIERLLELYKTHTVEQISDKINMTEGTVRLRLRQYLHVHCLPIPKDLAYKKRGAWSKKSKEN